MNATLRNRATKKENYDAEVAATISKLNDLHTRVLAQKEAEFRGMRETVASHTSQIQTKQEEISQLEAELNRKATSGNLPGYNNRIPGLKKELQETEDTIGSLTNTMEILRKRELDMIKRASTLYDQSIRNEETILDLKEQKAGKSTDTKSLETDHMEYNHAIQNLQGKESELQRTITAETEKLRSALQAQTNENKALETRIQQETEAIVGRIKGEMANMTTAHEQAKATLATNQASAIKAETKKHQEAKLALETEERTLIASHQQELSELERKCSEDKARLTAKQETLEQEQQVLKDQISTLEGENEGLTNDTDEFLNKASGNKQNTQIRKGFKNNVLKDLRAKAIAQKPTSGSSRRRSRKRRQ